MKNFLLLLLFISFSMGLKAQFQLIKLEEVKSIKNSKLVVGLTGNQKIDDFMIAAVNSHWKLGEIGEPIPVEEALNKTKSDNSITVIKMGTASAASLIYNFDDYWNYRYINSSNTLELYNGQKKAVFKQFMPFFGKDEEVTEEILRFGVAAMHYQLSVMEQNQLGVMKIKTKYKLNTPKLKELTLLMPEGWMDEKSSPETVNSLYSGKGYIVSYKMWRNAIIEREEGLAYSMICQIPMGNGYVYQHFLVEAKTGDVLAIIQSKAAVSFKLIHGKDVNLTKGNSGYINKKIIENYSKALEGKW